MATIADPEKQKRTPANTVPGYAAGAAVRRTLGRGVDAVKDVAVTTAARAASPFVRQLVAGAGFAGGLSGAGMNPPAAARPAAPAATPVRTQARDAARTPAGNAAPARTLPPVQNGSAAVVPTAAREPVAGTFNGRSITRSEADTIARRLPAAAPGSPVVAAPGGGVAYTPPAGGAANDSAVGGTEAAPGALPPRQQVVAPSSDTGRVRDAEAERAGLVRSLDSQLSRMSFGPSALNSRGERQLYADLLQQRTGLTRQAGDLAGQAAAGDQSTGTTAGIANAREAGDDARAALGETGADRRLGAQLAAEADREAAAGQRVDRVLTDTEGNVSVLRSNGGLAPLTDGAGKPFRAAPDPRERINQQVSADTEFKGLNEQLVALQSLGRPAGDAEGRAYDAQLKQIQARMAQLQGREQKVVVRTGTKDGRRVVQYSDGSIDFAD